ncbi:hypothetical protein QR680_008049 [Steinernema hermaphroditum]|uniref:Muscle M-line assembly protein unc-89 n=1 Tax=Steinernema hermaphroditum TaxID=289476 RepID=A0AA39IGL4_9BILA|nr:hypothetical protein QR680_008049 [Steinernema hermaphroditum]
MLLNNTLNDFNSIAVWRYTATEDVNYANHSARSAYRSESVTSRTNSRGRSSSTEVVSGSETRSLPVYIAIQDYVPEPTDTESIPLEQGQIVEVLDNKNPASWLVKTKARPPQTGWVPGSYFETPTEFYKQRRRTRELTSGDLKMTDEQEAIMKRDQVYHDLLHSEEEFVTHLRSAIDNYIAAFEAPDAPDEVKKLKGQLTLNLRELYNFHANVMLKGLQYYSDDPGKVGQTFVRLQKDFDHHVRLARDLPEVLRICEEGPLAEYLQNLSDRIEAGAKGYADYLKEAQNRMKEYENFFKEFIKYSSRASCSTTSMQKALELIKAVPKRTGDMEYINNIKNYPGDKNRLGHLYRHDFFQVWEGEGDGVDRYVFLFKNKVMITDKIPSEPVEFKHFATLRLDKYTVREYTITEDTLVLRPNEPGLPMFRMKAKDLASAEYVFKGWMKDMVDMQDDIAAEKEATESADTITEFDVNMSDVRSEFSEYSTMSRKSSLYTGPEEGPPRKKIKSPPVISPTGSSTSLYSGGSSSIDWTTTGTTLEMQGTRVTRTQYGFRTLQESSAKMCLKVTGYPLPDITWYKDDQLLSEDERHTFYADEDGFFAMTIDPVQVEDTGRYTCMATNEYGQASTSAFFRVLKVEKEAAPPAFVTKLTDQEVKEGETVNFECEVEGWPEPELLWLVDDQPLRPSHDFRLEYDGQSAKLEIRDAQPEDTGTYAVKITNEYGESRSSAQLTVQPDPDKNHVAPEFQAVIEDVECDEGDEVRFKAVLTGDPDPQVTWYINGVPLSESDKVKFILEDGICILTITDVTRHFDGIVTCQGMNRLGTTSCEGRLKVRVPPQAPEFNRPLEDRVISEKSSVVFECDVSGFPDPQVEFFLNNKKLSSGEENVEITGHDGYFRVEIKNCLIATHDGEIVAKATNEHGQAESRARLTVEPEDEESRSAPTFIKDIEDQTVKHGEKAVFEASVRGCPTPDVTWFVNGHKLDRDSPGVEIAVTNCDHKVTIDSAVYAGTVLCRAENSVGRYETKARLIVLPTEPKKKAPAFLQPLVNVTEIEGSTAVFEVTVDAEPKATLVWTLNGEEIKESSRFHFRSFDGSSKLEIHEIRIEEAGTVRCTATNSEGEAITECQFIVQRKACGPKFKEVPRTITVERGQEAVFEAFADAVPPATYQWSMDGKKVWNSTEGTRVETIEGRTRLIIDTTVHRETLTVSVIAENQHGMDESGARLIVEEKKVEEVRKEEARREETTHEEVSVSEETTRRAEEQRSSMYEESVSEHYEEHYTRTAPQVVSTTTVSEERFETTSTSRTGEITIEPIMVNGDIRIETTTTVEEQVTVSGRPVVKVGLKDATVVRGEEAKFSTVIESVSEKVEWFLNDQKLEPTQTGVSMTQEASEYHLALDSKVHPAGTVAAKAGDTVTTAKYDVTETKMEEAVKIEEREKFEEASKTEEEAKVVEGVKVEEQVPVERAPEKNIPEFTQHLSDVKVVEGEHFELHVTSSDMPTFKWTLNGQPMDAVEGVHIVDEGNKSTLSVDEATEKHTGEVKVTAENEAGKCESSAKIVVEKAEAKPQFDRSKTPADQEVSEGEPLKFEVALSQAPSADTKISWYINNTKLTASDEVNIVDGGDGTLRVEIAKAKPEMTGVLKCKAENAKGVDEITAKVTVKPSRAKPSFAKTPQDHLHETTDVESVKFSAIVVGNPQPEVTWYLNNEKIISSEAIRVKHETDSGKTSIRIFSPKVEQSGTVKVVASNEVGSVEATANLKIEKKAEIPRFVTVMNDKQLNEGETATFKATIAAYPEPEIVWTLNGEPLKPSENVIVTNVGDQHTLEMTKVTHGQTGEISCTATNAAGTKKQNATLLVKEVGEAPTFTRNLEDRLVEEKEVLIMEAKMADVKPKPTVQWFRDGQLIESDEHFRISEQEDGTLQLKIISAEMSDKARITIRAENKWGSAECTASIGVTKKRMQSKPAFLSDIAPITLNEGDSLQVKLIVTGDPEPYAKWYINDQMVYPTEDTEIKNENGVYSMTIHGVTTDMTGKIKCVIGNRMGEATTEGKLTVIQPIPVAFETVLCDATCREGDTLKLKAVLLGEPMPDVTWYVNGNKLEETQNIKIHAEKGTYTVTIKDITCDYSGKVVCEAINEYGKASSEAMLLVLPRGEPPDFLEWLSNVRARQGSKVVHKVVFTGDPKPTLTWFINNEEVHSSEEISIVTDNSTSTLTINNFNPDKHIGEIICKAENEAGEVSCTANMGTYTSDMFSESESEAMAEENLEMEELTEVGTDHEESLHEDIARTPTPVMAPKFITKIKDTRAKRGHQAIFECVVPDTKGVCCKWLKDGKEIELIARIRVQTRTIEGYTTNELIIDEVVPEDAGKYTVIVENRAGQDTCEATLHVVEVIEKPEERQPEFVVQLKDKSVKASEKVTFECKVVGEPQPQVTWYHGEEKLEEVPKKVIIESDESIHRLVIEATEVRDEGSYSCVAENTAGTTKSEATLQVISEPPHFTKSLQDKSVKVGEKVILDCSVKGVPQPTVEFYHESTRITSSQRITVEHDASNTHWRIVIKEATTEDFRKYRAEAKNSAGTAISEATVIGQQSPVFEQGLKKTSVKEKETVRMEVKVNGFPNPELKWFKDGQPVVADGSRIVIKEETLIINEARIEDSGTYTVEATNAAGKETSSAPVTVEPSAEGPKFTEGLKSVSIKESETAEMSVTVAGKPEPEVQWFKDSQPVQVDGAHFIEKKDSEGHHTLIIKDARVEDKGTYSCKATNVAGTAESSATVTVEIRQAAPQFTETLKSVTIKESESTQLSVTVTGQPEPEVTWFKDSQPVQVDGTHFVSKKDSEGHHSLTIKEAKIEDLGTYSCKATNVAGFAESSSTVNVEARHEAPQFVEALRSVSIQETESTELSVTVSGKPEPEVKWFKDSQPVQIDGSHVVEKKDSEGHHTLIIKDARVEDKGTYSCKASNIAGYAECTASVNVQIVAEGPKFTEPLKSVSIKETEFTELSITVAGKPEPEIQWFKDSQPIQMDGTHFIEKKVSTGQYTLTIRDARLTDLGTYSCQATNVAGKAETSASVTVLEKMTGPEFVKKLMPIQVKESQNAQFEVTVTGKPEPKITWYKDEQPIEADGSHIVTRREEKGQYTMIINQARLEDVGTYSCRATNEFGMAESKASFGVQEVLEAPEFKDTLKALEVKESETAEMSVTVAGRPEPEVTWYKDSQPIQIDGSHLVEKKDSEGHHTLIIKDARLEDVGTYSCKAVNKAGTAESKASFGVQEVVEAPEFTDALRPIEVRESETAEMSVTVAGRPEPEVTWYKDSQPVQIDGSHVVEKKDSEGHHTLVIKDARLEDVGTYSCKAVNKAGTAETRASFGVQEVLEAPEFTEGLTEAEVTQGEEATLQCTVVGKPEPEVVWKKDGVPVNVDQSHVISKKDQEGHHSLVIKNVASEDVGTYSCEAVNKAGKAETAASLKFPKYGFERAEEGVVEPFFVESLKPAQVTEGDTVILECRVNKESSPEVHWFRDSQEIVPGPNVVVEKLDDGLLRLKITKATHEDLGAYKCEAVNKAGKADTVASLDVKYAEEKKAEEAEEVRPMFIEPLHETTVTEGATVSMECRVNQESHPTIQWFKDDKPVQLGDHVLVEQTDDGKLKITIHNATQEDVGAYRCEAVNKAGKADTVAKLDLKYAEEKEAVVGEEVVQPMFIEPLHETAVTEGATVTMECQVNEESHPEIQWYKDDKPVQLGDHVVVEHTDDGKLKITIQNATKEDVGAYRCEAVNKAGTATTSAALTLQYAEEKAVEHAEEGVLEEIGGVEKAPEEVVTELLAGESEARETAVGRSPPEFVELLRSATTTIGGTAILRCKVKGAPRPKIKWTKDGQDVEMSVRIRSVYAEDGSIELTVENVSKADEGEYRCEASNELGTAWTEGPITVAEEGTLPTEGEAPDFLQPVRPITVTEGETAILEGKTSGEPQPKVKWYKNQVELKPDDRVTVESLPDGTQRLTIKNATMADMDEYRCEASNDYGDVWSDVTLTVKVAQVTEPFEKGQVAPTFVKTLEEVRATEGDHVELECIIVGEPMPEISQDAHFHQTTKSDGTARLTIDSVEVADAGEYRCEAKNPAGTARTEAPLKVVTAEEEHLLTEVAPEFSKDLKAVQAKEGEPVVFECKISAMPQPQVKWFKDGEELKPGDGIEIEALDDGTNRLKIDKAKVDDQGNYRVEATNNAGSMSSKAPLTVTAVEKLKLKKGLEDQKVPLGARIRLSIEVEGKPKTVKWFRGHEEVVSSTTTHIEKVTDEEYKLEIEKAELSDDGAYRVVLSTETESIESSCQVTVTSVEVKPSFAKGLEDKSVPKGSALALEIEVDGKPKQVKWLKNGSPVDERRAKVEDLGNGKYRLTIPEMGDDDFGDYSVVVSNDAGEATSKAKVTVAEGKPELVSGLVPTSVKEGETVKLEVKTKGPVKQVKWYRNGDEIKDAETKDLGDGTYQLIIPSAKKSDAGEYKVVLSNDAGSVDSSAALTVKKEPIRFKKGLEDQTAKVGDKVILEVETNGKPKQVKWYKNGKEIAPGDHAEPKAVSDTKYQLVIPEATEDDSADFKVVVTDDDGESADSSCALTVKLPAEEKPYEEISIPVPAIAFKKGLEDQTVKPGEKAVLEIETNKKPKQVKWYKNGKEIAPGAHAEPKAVSDTVYQLVIPDATEDDTADYKVVVTDDDDNTADSSCALTVKLPAEEKPFEEISIPVPAIGFKKGLEDQTVKPGDKAVLEVETNKKPKQVKWYKNGKEIAPGANAQPKAVSDTVYQLVIPDATEDDTADYKVVIGDDDDNTADSSCALTVKLPAEEKPYEEISIPVPAIGFKKGLEDQTVKPGDKAVLEVETNKKPKQVKWYKNGKEIAPGANAQPKAVSDTVYQLVIPDATKDDSADYKVVVTDDDNNTADSSGALTVKLPGKISIVKGLEDQTVKPGVKVILEVEVDRAPKQVKWYKNGKEVAPGDKATPKKVDDKKYQLEIPDAQDGDSADYEVVLLDDEDNTADSSCALTVKLPSEQPKFVKGLEDVFIPVGSPLELEIKTSGSPKIVRWYRNGQEVTAETAAKVKLTKVDDNNYTLKIDKSEVADSGTYQVEIENDAGKAKSIGDVTVEVPIEFLKPLKDVEVREGEQAQFEVETNTKVRKVTWYRNGQEIKTDSRVITRVEETKFRLVIKTSVKEDAGTYKVVLWNSCGEVDSEAKLTVKKAKGDEPKILKGLEDQVVSKGADLVFEVRIQGEDLELKWFKDGQPVGASAKIEKIDDNTYRLTVPKADIPDAGQYSVEVANDAGKAKSSASGEVDEVPEIVKGLEDSEISQDDDQLFRVEVSAPVRQVKWYKNGQEIKPVGNVTQKKVSAKKYELCISKAQLDDAGTFKVVLSNAAGSCESSAALSVVKPNILKVLKGLEDVTVTDGEPVELSCKVEGTPKTVRWYKNGQEIKPDDRVHVEENPATGEYFLKIPQSTVSDGAAYRIVLTNERGEVYSGSVAHVRAKKPEAVTEAANFVSPLKDTDVPEGDTLTLKCQVSGQPEPEVKWYRNGQELSKDDRTSIRLAFDGTATLRIRDSKKSDAGEYHVVASNEAGSSESRCKVGVLAVEELPEPPKFVIPLRNIGAFPGAKAEFNVKVRGVPRPALTWFLNGKPISLEDPRFAVEDMADGNFTLVIKDVQAEDYGTIRCVAENDSGKDECEAEFSESKDKPERIKEGEGYPPRFNVPLWDRRIPEGDPLSIECHVDAKPLADIRWTKDGELLQESENVQIWNTPDGACRVKISKFTQYDIGVYKCQAKNCHGVADTRANYNVEVELIEERAERKEYPPRFNPQLSDVSVPAGATISLSCGVDAVPTASVVWYKDGLPVKLDGRVEAEYDEKSGQCRLTIRDARDSDDGAYRCVATNEHGTTNTACLVGVKSVKEEVKKEGEEPFFTKGLVDTWTDRGETLTLKCCVTGDPRPEIKWYRNGVLLRDSQRVSLDYASDGTCTCVVRECNLSDEGIYRCEAENSLGKAKTQATAHIEMGRAKADKVKLPEGEAPRFVIPLEDMTVLLGSSLELECKVAGQPMPQVKWAKDGAPVWDDPRYEWTTDATAEVYKLYIKEATIYDEGTYRCVATNDSGQATSKAYVKIDDGTYGAIPKEAAMTPPRITLHLGDARATEGQPLKLECKIEANPLPELTWYKDGERIIASDNVRMELDPDGTARLIIPQCTMDDDGIYRVIATNPAGSAHDKANATVKRAPAGLIENGFPEEDFQASKAPKVIIPLENVKVPEKHKISLRCKFSGDPRPSIKWFKDGERIYAFGRCQLTENEDGNCELIIDSAGRMDNGCYRCVAENIYGAARTMCEVIVQLKERKPRDFEAELKEGNAPGFSIPVTDKRVKQGDTVTFECLPYGNPFPSIKWMKDGIELLPSPEIKMEATEDGTQHLILSNVDFLSEGYYRCVATNDYGTASTKAELNLSGKGIEVYCTIGDLW